MVPQKLNIKLPYNSAIPLLAINSEELKIGPEADTKTPLLIAALFTIAKGRNNPTEHQPTKG